MEMLRRAAIIATAMLGLASLTVAAFAEDNGDDFPPSCPGGSVPKGTFHCTGPVFYPTCRETGPWVCVPAGGSTGLTMSLPPRVHTHPRIPVGVTGVPVRGLSNPGTGKGSSFGTSKGSPARSRLQFLPMQK
jgi:hypothetical protein